MPGRKPPLSYPNNREEAVRMDGFFAVVCGPDISISVQHAAAQEHRIDIPRCRTVRVPGRSISKQTVT